jgi:acyl carrier protein
MFGGESVSEKFVCEALKYNIKLVQLFGFTEHAVYTNYQWIHSVNDCNLIGTSFSGTKVIVVDKDGQPKPDGFEGQLASIGIGVSRGYYLLEENTTFKMFKGQRMFLSGDICRKDLNGIKFLGRKDDVVKFNGQKVNLSLVDRMLCSLDGVEQVSTIKDDHRLISFLITHHSIEEIQSQMKRKWPNWTIPLMLHRVDSLSLTSNGKIDKSKLKSSIKNDSVVEVFQRFLGKDYKLDDDFLSAGVDSIQLLQVAQLLDERFGIELDVRNAFKSRNGREWIKTSKSNLEIKIGVASYNQEHLWLLGDISPEFADSYKIQFKLKFYSPIDKQRLQSAINRIIEENESLRICVKMDENNQIKQFLLPYKYDIDFKSLPISYQFLDDISVRIELHHIAVDGYSLFLIVNQLASYYTDVFQKGRSIFSPIEFAKNQRQMNFAREIEYFRFQLSTCLNDVLPTEFDRSVSNLAGHERITISFNLKNNSYSLFYVTLTAYLKHLSNETNTKSLVIAIPFSNRTSRNANAIGYFTNALPVHFDLNGKDGDKLIEYVRDRVLETLQFSEIPFSLLVRKLEPRRTKLVNPIYQRMFSFEDFYVTEVDGIFSIHEIDSSHSKLDQTWHVHKIDQKTLQIHVEYNSHLFSLNRINQSLNSFKDEFLSLIRDDDDVQKRLFRLFREELLVNEEDLSEKSNFFELGGHSLSAARLASRIRSEIRMECSTRDIFENQTIKELVIMLKKETSSNFVEVSNIQATILRVMAENKSNVLRSQYSNEFQVIIENRDREEIKEMIFQIIATQEALRTKFVIRNGQFMMQCLPIKNINLPYTIISEDFEMETVFIDLREKNELCVRISHLVSDGPSMSILMRYLTEKIKPKSSISEFNTKFNKYCLEFKDKNVQFWASIMKFKNSAIFCDQHVQNPSKSSSLSLCISRQALIEKVINKKVSLNAFLLHKLASTLKHWEIEDSNSTDLYIGIVKDMRSSIENADFSQTIGFFTQTLPIPCKNRNLIELDKLLHNSYDHAFINYESLLEVSNQANLFEVMLAVNYEEKSQVETNQSIDVKGKFPLTFYVQIGKNEAHIELVYWNELWFEDTARSMLETFASMIDPSICVSYFWLFFGVTKSLFLNGKKFVFLLKLRVMIFKIRTKII